MNSLIKCKRVCKLKKSSCRRRRRPVRVTPFVFRDGSGLNKNSRTSRGVLSYFGIFRATLGNIDPFFFLEGEKHRDIGNIQYLINCIFDAKSHVGPFTFARGNEAENAEKFEKKNRNRRGRRSARPREGAYGCTIAM